MLAHAPRAPPTPPYSSMTPPAEDSMVAGKPPLMPSDAPHLVDWLDFTRARSAHFIAEKTCEMICYLWHATPTTPTTSITTSTSTTNPYPSPNNSPPSSALTYSSNPTPATSAHQLHVYPEFVSFVQKILETTQVSQSVIVLSLHYIWKFKQLTKLVGPSGSEYRIAVAGLMMANKFLDDNTYTNKTWSEVSGIPLVDINHMEAEFLKGIDHNLYVDKATYGSWLHLLKGLVMAKEKDLWRAKGGHRRYGARKNPGHHHQAAHTPAGRARHYRTAIVPRESPQHQHNSRQTPRARSTSPISRSSFPHYQLPPLQPQPQTHLPPPSLPPPTRSSPRYDVPASSYNYKPASYNYSPSPAPSSLKRSAATAFSPTSATFSQVPMKRSEVEPAALPTISSSNDTASTIVIVDAPVSSAALQRPGITLQIPHDTRHTQPQQNSNSSPMDGLPIQGFAKMNLDSGVPSAYPATATSTATATTTTATTNSLSSALGPMPGDWERERERERMIEYEREREMELERERERQRQREGYRMTTLVQPYHYSLEEQRKSGVPKHLYFYTLACSPLEDGPSRAASPIYTQQSSQPQPHVIQYPHSQQQREDDEESMKVEDGDYDYDMDADQQLAVEKERQLEYERQRELEIERQREAERERERQAERERERELEREQREREREREKERERERIRKARLRVHKPAQPSTIRYSDYAYMPYVSSSTATATGSSYAQPQQPTTATSTGSYSYPHHPSSQPPPSTATAIAATQTYLPSHSTTTTAPAPTPASLGPRLPGPAAIIAQTQSARTSPVISGATGGVYHHQSYQHYPQPQSQSQHGYQRQQPEYGYQQQQQQETSYQSGGSGRHFDAVRFEVERTQGYATASKSGTAANAYYTPESTSAPAPGPTPAPAPTSVPAPVTAHPQRRNPYPKLSPPTPVTSTRTSPVAGVAGVVAEGGGIVCRGPCCVPPPTATATTTVAARVSPVPASNQPPTSAAPYGSPYSSLAGATSYPTMNASGAANTTATTTTTSGNGYYGGYNGYERVCVSAYTSPAMPAYSTHPPPHSHYQLSPASSMPISSTGQGQQQQQQRQGVYSYSSYSYPTPHQHQAPPSTVTTTTTAHLSAKEREELAFAKATAEVNAVNAKHSQSHPHSQSYSPSSSPAQSSYETSPGVPSMPFANAGPPGVFQMSYSPSAGSGSGYDDDREERGGRKWYGGYSYGRYGYGSGYGEQRGEGGGAGVYAYAGRC